MDQQCHKADPSGLRYKNYWQIIDDQIIFTSQEKLNEYTKMALDVPDSLQ